MSRLQRVFLIGSCILFAATIYSLFFLNLVFIIIFFVLHSLCIFSFCYVCYTDQTDKEMSLKAYHQEVGQEIAAKEEKISNIMVQMREKDNIIQRIHDQIETLRTRNESFKDEASNMLSRIRKLEEEKQEKEQELAEVRREQEQKQRLGKDGTSQDFGALLPPVTGGSEGRETVNIIAIANQAKNSLMENAKAANLHITVSSATDTLMVTADQGRLMTLFRNIIDNSIKYMKRAGSLVITISTIGDDIFIVLKDTGEGLPKEETKYIFELNYQGSNRISGNGLGLAQARAIVEYYGGTIYAKSTVGNGMGIYIQIPTGGHV
ncbi:MAG: HAMP domain-containing histidine kinase [Eubacterium sp.]|nr:HAMP domain-containing histidine kinase [Eubacterium sp.]